ncbi:CD44 antigen isoform X10 [Arvicanthis niloticus]|uniref:CD44 antigen isoform X10 n=1 Tax=Arvicanthis niloticus TaxID=61156 RepID=UPI00402B8BAA
MDKFWWHTAWGLCLLQLSLAQPQIDLNITCRYAGVFHVEKNGRYSISRTEAADLCQAFNSTLPTMAQMELALSKGFETCRYGFIEGNVVIPRIHPNAICAANNTGVYILLTSNTSHYDTYCFNASAPLEEDCTSVTDLPNSFDGPVTITIVNRDGTRYSKKGEYRTHQEDIDASNTIDDDFSSGSTIETSTSEGYIFHTHLPTTQPTGDQDDNFIGSTSATNMDSSHSTTLQPTSAPNTHLVEDLNRTGPLSVTTPQSHSQNFSTLQGKLEEYEDHPTTSILPSSTKSGSKNTRRGGSLPSDTTTSVEGYTPHYPDTMENGTLFPMTPAKTEVFEETEVTVATDSNFNVDGSKPGSQGSSMDPSGGSRIVTRGSELAGHSSGNQDSGVTTTSGPERRPQIPEWLIILASLLALVLILAVCIAVNSRRRCGQKKKLVINSGNGTVEDRKPSELNGEASKSQEMVHLVNKEPSETPDQFMTADETRNLQSVDMKIGV